MKPLFLIIIGVAAVIGVGVFLLLQRGDSFDIPKGIPIALKDINSSNSKGLNLKISNYMPEIKISLEDEKEANEFINKNKKKYII